MLPVFRSQPVDLVTRLNPYSTETPGRCLIATYLFTRTYRTVDVHSYWAYYTALSSVGAVQASVSVCRPTLR